MNSIKMDKYLLSNSEQKASCSMKHTVDSLHTGQKHAKLKNILLEEAYIHDKTKQENNKRQANILLWQGETEVEEKKDTGNFQDTGHVLVLILGQVYTGFHYIALF